MTIANNGSGQILDGGAFNIDNFVLGQRNDLKINGIDSLNGTFSSSTAGSYEIETSSSNYSGVLSQASFGNGLDVAFLNGIFSGQTTKDQAPFPFAITVDNGNFEVSFGQGQSGQTTGPITGSLDLNKDGTLNNANLDRQGNITDLVVKFTSENGGNISFKDAKGNTHTGTFSK